MQKIDHPLGANEVKVLLDEHSVGTVAQRMYTHKRTLSTDSGKTDAELSPTTGEKDYRKFCLNIHFMK